VISYSIVKWYPKRK